MEAGLYVLLAGGVIAAGFLVREIYKAIKEVLDELAADRADANSWREHKEDEMRNWQKQMEKNRELARERADEREEKTRLRCLELQEEVGSLRARAEKVLKPGTMFEYMSKTYLTVHVDIGIVECYGIYTLDTTIKADDEDGNERTFTGERFMIILEALEGAK